MVLGPRIGVLLTLGLAGCTPPPAPPPPLPTMVVEQAPPPPAPVTLPTFDPVLPSATYLDPKHDAEEPRHAVLTEVGPLFWTLDDAQVGEPKVEPDSDAIPAWEATYRVVERHARHFRVLWDRGGLRATFYLPIASFRELITAPTLVRAPDGRPFANGCGVTLAPGTWPQFGERGDMVEVTYRSDWLSAKGTVPAEAIDRLYVLEKGKDPPGTARLTAPVKLLDAPSGQVVAEVHEGDAAGKRLGDPEGGFQKVAFQRQGVKVTGYAPKAAVSDTDAFSLGFGGFGGGTGWGMSHVTWMYLWPGDRLSIPTGQEAVAEVTRRRLNVVDRGAQEDGSHRVQARLGRWGLVNFVVDATTAERATRRQQAWLERTQVENLVVTPRTHEAAVVEELRWEKRGVGICYDHRFDDGERPPLRYSMTARFAADGALTLEIAGPPATTEPLQRMEKCLRRTLDFRRRGIERTTARFDLVVTPDPDLSDAP